MQTTMRSASVIDGAHEAATEKMCIRDRYEEGTQLGPEAIAILAAGGWAQVPVRERLRIAYVPTGNELVAVGTVPERGQNVQTNSLMLGAYFQQWGAQMVEYGIVPDDRAALGAALGRALEEADMVLINGGSSRGSEDYNSELLQERATFFAHGVKAVPGLSLIHISPCSRPSSR